MALQVALSCLAALAVALDNGHPLPSMGWNSWVNYGCNVSEALIKTQATALQRLGLDKVGFRYMNIDDCWQAADRDAATGRLVANADRFPSGIDGLADWLHARGLKLGIYSDVGPATCQGFPGSYGHYDLDAQTFADWGIDYLKFDTCHLTAQETKDPGPFYANMSAALNATGKDIVFSICNWGKHDPWEWAPAIANSWRTTQDLYPSWNRVVTILDATAPLAAYATRGAFNDPDMLEVGINGTFFNWQHFPVKTNLTQREASAHLSLWVMLSAPLILGFDLAAAAAADWAVRAVSNAELLAVNQDGVAAQAERVAVTKTGTWVGPVCAHVPVVGAPCAHTEVWSKRLAGGKFAVALFNRADPFDEAASQFGDERVSAAWADVGIAEPGAPFAVRNVLAQADVPGVATGELNATVPPHGVALYVLTPQ